MPTFRSRLDAAERIASAYFARAPWMIEHAPDGSVLLRLNGVEQEMKRSHFEARFPGVRFLTWADAPTGEPLAACLD